MKNKEKVSQEATETSMGRLEGSVVAVKDLQFKVDR